MNPRWDAAHVTRSKLGRRVGLRPQRANTCHSASRCAPPLALPADVYRRFLPRGNAAGGRGVGRGGGRRARRREWRAGAGMGWRRARPRARRVLWRLLAAAMAGSMISSAVCQRVTSARCDQRRFDSNSRQRPRNVRRRFEPRFCGTRGASARR